MVYLELLLVLAVPLGVVALAVSLDKRSGRGYGLGLLSVATLIFDAWITVLYLRAEEQSNASHTDNLGFIVVVLLYLVAASFPAIAIVVGGIAESFSARQWWWLGIIAAAALVPTAITVGIGGALIPDFPAGLGLSRDGEFMVPLFLPMLVTLAYAVIRTIRPVAPAAARQPLAAR